MFDINAVFHEHNAHDHFFVALLDISADFEVFKLSFSADSDDLLLHGDSVWLPANKNKNRIIFEDKINGIQ